MCYSIKTNNFSPTKQGLSCFIVHLHPHSVSFSWRFYQKIKIKLDHVSQLKMTEGLANQFTCCSCIPSKYLWSATVLGRLFNKIFPGIQCVHYQPGKVTCEDENIYTESKLVIKWCFMDVSEGIERNLLIDEDVIKLLQRIVDREAYSNQRDLIWSGKK